MCYVCIFRALSKFDKKDFSALMSELGFDDKDSNSEDWSRKLGDETFKFGVDDIIQSAEKSVLKSVILCANNNAPVTSPR